ncbi:MAG TPA: glycosyltransferase family 39 protein [Solirubrobacteraceae bacterium]|nr:glycosyltransferase family 39 protein [Solirubrobacteraceae bacterium]
MTQRVRSISLPIVLLGVLSLLSLGARVAWLNDPCQSPCGTSTDHVLVFDESYYVNAARIIARIAPPPNATYATAPLGDDPNAEHPQLVKLLMAGSIELLGDGPLAWRLTSLVFGSLAILGMFALVRAAGGGPWVALGAATLMAADTLLLIHSRIGTLDVPVAAMMIWAAVLYLRGRPLAAGVAIGVGTCMKLVAPYVLLVLALYEAGRAIRARRERTRERWWRPVRRLASCGALAAGVFVGLLAVLDRIAPPYDPLTSRRVTGGVFGHIAHMLTYAAHQTSPHGPTGIASDPWTWIVDYKPITYLNVNPSKPVPGLIDVRPAVHFTGVMSPPLMALALPSLALAAWTIASQLRGRPGVAEEGELPLVGLAWFIGTWLPFALLALLFDRTSYLYYMVVVMPGIYITVMYLLYRARRHRKLIALYALTVLIAAIALYPLVPLPWP